MIHRSKVEVRLNPVRAAGTTGFKAQKAYAGDIPRETIYPEVEIIGSILLLWPCRKVVIQREGRAVVYRHRSVNRTIATLHNVARIRPSAVATGGTH